MNYMAHERAAVLVAFDRVHVGEYMLSCPRGGLASGNGMSYGQGYWEATMYHISSADDSFIYWIMSVICGVRAHSGIATRAFDLLCSSSFAPHGSNVTLCTASFLFILLRTAKSKQPPKSNKSSMMVVTTRDFLFLCGV